ncbi:MAG: GAF domain-containing protein [Gammaproteobacteria bacterium]
MNTRTLAALLISILAAVVCIYLPFVPQTVLPFGTKPLDREHYMVGTSSYDVPLPAGLQVGDVVNTTHMDTLSRLGVTTFSIPPAGTRITLNVSRQGHELQVPVMFVPMPVTVLNMTDVVLGIALIWLVAALGLLILWRGYRLAATGVGIWCLAKLCWEIPISLPLPLSISGWVDVSGMAVRHVGTLVGLYLVAEDLALEQVDIRTRRLARSGFILLMIIYLLGFSGNDLAFLLGGQWLFNPAHLNARVVAHVLAFAIPVVLLVLRYRRVQAMERARIRWVLLSALGIVAAYLVTGSLEDVVLNDVTSDILYSAFNAAAFIGFTYAVLRHRLVAVRVVLNRALAYGFVLTVIVVVFSVLESLIEHAALGDKANELLLLGVPLVLGILLNNMHKRIEHWVEYLFFRRQFHAEAALSQFAKECGFITSAQVLLDRAVNEVMRHTGAPAVAIYEYVGNGYRRLRQQGERSFPAKLSIDDPACVRLRANLTQSDLDDLGSALGEDGLVFPVALRGLLVGTLVCASRPGELYTPKEQALLQHVTREVGASLHAMYVDETQSFMSEVANGVLPASAETQGTAKRLIRGELAA